MATFNEKHASTSKKYVVEQGLLMSNRSKITKRFRLHFSVFAIENLLKNLNFRGFFSSNRPSRGYFQWILCIDFQNICSWTTYIDTKLMKNISNILVALLRFCFRNTAWKSKFWEFFLPLIDCLVATFNEKRTLTSKKYVAEQGIAMPNWSKTFPTFWLHSSVFFLRKTTLWQLLSIKRVHRLPENM